MRDARVRVEANGVGACVPTELAPRATAQLRRTLESRTERLHRTARGLKQQADLTIALRVGGEFGDLAPLFDLSKAVSKSPEQQFAATRVVEQVVFEIRVALHRPDIAEDFVQHARRTARPAFTAQFIEQRPTVFTEQSDDDFAIRERGVVVGDLANARCRALGRGKQG
jgi:hypothetical protein